MTEINLEPRVLGLVPSTDPILFNPVAKFDFSNPPIDPVYLANCLILTMNNQNGLGLSANQCGLPYRVFVMRAENAVVCYNPKIVEVSSELVNLDEGCLSYPFLFVKIKRPAFVKTRFTDAFGQTSTETFVGMTARCFLHEMDHLEGINFTQRANKALLERAKRQRIQIQRRIKPAMLAV
jgi:peptide deformylase